MYRPKEEMQSGISLTVPFCQREAGLTRHIQALQPLAVWTLLTLNTEPPLTVLSNSLQGSIITPTEAMGTAAVCQAATVAQVLFVPIAAANVWAEI